MSKPDLKYQQNVAGILRNRDGKILICERLQAANAWQFPQGGVDEGETVEEALTRELWEEIGVKATDFRILEKKSGYAYIFANGPRRGHDGKKQTYFLCEFLGDDRKINVATPHPEFRAFKWIFPSQFSKDWLPAMKQEVYAAVFRDFFGVKI